MPSHRDQRLGLLSPRVVNGVTVPVTLQHNELTLREHQDRIRFLTGGRVLNRAEARIARYSEAEIEEYFGKDRGAKT